MPALRRRRGLTRNPDRHQKCYSVCPSLMLNTHHVFAILCCHVRIPPSLGAAQARPSHRTAGIAWQSKSMEFGWTEDQLALKKAVLDFANSELKRRKDGNGDTLWRDAWNKCANFGILGLYFPSVYGGQEAGGLGTALAMETLGTVCPDAGLLFGLSAQMWSVQMPIWRFGTGAQKDRYLPALIKGESVGAHGMSEPESGSDAFSLRTSAVRDGDFYVLNGKKTFVTSAPDADLFVIFARLGNKPGISRTDRIPW